MCVCVRACVRACVCVCVCVRETETESCTVLTIESVVPHQSLRIDKSPNPAFQKDVLNGRCLEFDKKYVGLDDTVLV